MKPSRILFTGGRDFADQELLDRNIAILVPWFADEFCVIQGGAKGLDKMAKDWAHKFGFPCLTVEANWDYYNKGAGHVRNGWMLQWGLPHLLVAFPGGPGTANMVKQAKLINLPIYFAK